MATKTKKKEDEAAAATSEYYDYTAILAEDAVYNIIIGQRSNGKTYGWCKMALQHYFQDGLPSAYVRRLDEMIKPKIIQGLFDPHRKLIEELSEGKYNGITYRGNEWHLIKTAKNSAGNEEVIARDPQYFCRSYAVSTTETTKGPDYGQVWSICFDEFITRQYYLANESVLLEHCFSSIIRDRPGIKIFMIANTVSKYCPYFRDFGLYRIKEQKQGTIDIYRMGKTETKIAVEYCATIEHVKKSVSKYFCFNNPALEMITKGVWEIALYRHAPMHLSQYRCLLSFFVIHEDQTIQGDIIQYKGYPIIFWHDKTTPIKKPEKSIIYCTEVSDGNPLHQIDMRTGFTRAQEIIYDLVRMQKTFYADNETGEAVAAYLRTCGLEAR